LRLCVKNSFVKQIIDVFPRKGSKNFQLPTCSFPHFSIFEQNKFLEIFRWILFKPPSTYHPL